MTVEAQGGIRLQQRHIDWAAQLAERYGKTVDEVLELALGRGLPRASNVLAFRERQEAAGMGASPPAASSGQRKKDAAGA